MERVEWAAVRMFYKQYFDKNKIEIKQNGNKVSVKLRDFSFGNVMFYKFVYFQIIKNRFDFIWLGFKNA